MLLHWFNPPVPIKVRVGLILNVSSVETAGEELLKFTKRGPHWRRAVQCCVAFGGAAGVRSGRQAHLQAGR